MTIYLVERPFHSLGKFYRAGDVITSLSDIREGKVRIARREIAVVDTENIQALGARLAKIEMKAGRPLKEEILAAASAVDTDEIIDPVDPVDPPKDPVDPAGAEGATDLTDTKNLDTVETVIDKEESKETAEADKADDTVSKETTETIKPVDVPVVAKPAVPELKTTPAKPITKPISK